MKKSHVRQNIDFYDLHFETIQKEEKEKPKTLLGIHYPSLREWKAITVTKGKSTDFSFQSRFI